MPIPNPEKGEKKEDFIGRCMSDLSGDYEDTSQRYAVCNDSWSKHFSKQIGQFKAQQEFQIFSSVEQLHIKLSGGVSMDYDDTLSTDRGKQIAKQLISKGVDLHIITRRQETAGDAVYKTAEELHIPRNKVHFTNGKLKWETIKRLGITKHYDNNSNELDAIKKNLPNVKTVQFSLEQY